MLSNPQDIKVSFITMRITREGVVSDSVHRSDRPRPYTRN